MSSSKTLCVSQTFLAGTSSHSNLPFWRALRQWRPMAAAARLWMRCDPHRVFPASPSGPRRRGDPRRPVFTPSDQFGKTGPAETAPGAASARIGRHVCGRRRGEAARRAVRPSSQICLSAQRHGKTARRLGFIGCPYLPY